MFGLFKKKNEAKEAVQEVAKKEKYIENVMEKTGWSREEAEEAMKKAKEKVGISFRDYAAYSFHEVAENRQEAGYEKIKRRKELRAREKEECIQLSMEKMGWSREKAEKHLKAAREKTGISYREYRRFHFFKIAEEDQIGRFEEITKEKQARKDKKGDDNDRFLVEISEITGWTEKQIEKKVRRARVNSGATLKDYYAFKFWEIDESEQRQYFTQKVSNKISDRYDTNNFHRDILLNKELSCEEFSDLFHRPWCINRGISLEAFQEAFGKEQKVVYKPLAGHGGLGIKVVSLENLEAAYEELMAMDRGVVEGFVVQHEAMASLAPGSVNTVRFVTVATDDEPGKIAPHLVYAALRVGSGTSFVDNFSDGGLVLGVDLKTGKVETNGVTIDGTPFENHPDTGTRFKGFQIPFFEEAKEMTMEAAKRISGYLGWDIAITGEGPVLIEANIMPGNRILQMPYVEDRIGKMSLMAPFVPDGDEAYEEE